MSENSGTAYGFGVTTAGPFNEAVTRVRDAFKAEGFGVVTEMNVQALLREKIGQEMEPYQVLGVCNPHLASQAIAAEHEIGVMLPCTVLIHDCGGQVRVLAQDPLLMMQVASAPALEPIAREARARMEKALESLAA